LERDENAPVAVLAPLSVIVIWWIATHGKGGAALRLVAWLAAAIVVWVLIALKNPPVAGAIATGWVTGLAAFISDLGHFLGALNIH
jgi:hypothetical protein